MPQQQDPWVTVTPAPQNDPWVTVTPQANKPEAVAPDSSWFDTVASYIPQPVKSAWDWASSPLTTLPTQAGKAVSDYIGGIPITGETGEGGLADRLANVNARAKGFFQGASEGAGDFFSGLTSPINLATFGAGGIEKAAVEKGLPQLANVAGLVSKAAGVPMALHGAGEIANPASTMQQRAQGVFEAAGGAMPFAHAPELPVKQPSIEKAMKGSAEVLPVKQPGVREPIKQTIPYEPPSSKNAANAARQEAALAQLESAGMAQGEQPFDASTVQYPGTETVAEPPAQSTIESAMQPVTEPTTSVVPPAPEGLQFTDPVTGEIRSPAEAKPGDIPLIPGQEPIPPETPKPRSANKIANMSSGETPRPKPEDIIGMSEAPTGTVMPTGRAAEPSVGKEPKLPAVLRNAKTNYSHQEVQFANDLDKAAYIIARENRRSKYDHLYLKFVMDNTGLDEAGARSLGRQVKAAVKGLSSGDTFDDIKMPPTARNLIQQRAAESANVSGKTNLTPEQKMQALSERVRAAEQTTHPEAQTARELDNAVKVSEQALKEAPKEKKPGIISRALQLQKAWITSADLGAPGRQGKAFILNKEWYTSLGSMVKAWGSENAAKIIDQSIEEHPSGFFKHDVTETGKVKPSWAEKVAGLNLPTHEEVFNSKLGADFRKYSGINKASRAHTAFLNKLRSDMFVKMMKSAEDAGLNPKQNIEFAKKYANFINNATGRGKLSAGSWNFEYPGTLKAANAVMFAPKNMAGQIKTWGTVLDPRTYSGADPVMRKQALKSLFAIAGLGTTVSTLAQAAGAKVSFDPTSSDFLKMQFGRTRVDPFGGYQQMPVAAAKAVYLLSTGALSGKKTLFGHDTAKDTTIRYFSNRLSPSGRFVFDLFGNKMFNGMPFNLQAEMYEQVAPIAISEVIDVLRENPVLGTLLTPSTLMGLTGNAVYRDRKTGR